MTLLQALDKSNCSTALHTGLSLSWEVQRTRDEVVIEEKVVGTMINHVEYCQTMDEAKRFLLGRGVPLRQNWKPVIVYYT